MRGHQLIGPGKQEIEIYQTKTKPVAGTNYTDVYKKSFEFHERIRKKSKRRPYIRSAYFNRQKIFLGIFWSHLHAKLNYRDKTRRAKLFPCAVELIQHSRCQPFIQQSLEEPDELLYRFAGITPDQQLFIVQIKKNMRSGGKRLISVFPTV